MLVAHRVLRTRKYPDEREVREIRVGKFRHIAVAAPDPQEGGAVQRNPGHFKMQDRSLMVQVKGHEIEPLFHDPVHRFPAADMFVLVTAAHVGQAALRKRLERHRCRVMITGEEIPALVREALPALQPEGLGAEFQGAAVHEQHSLVHPFHRHGIEYREEGGIAELFMAVGACRIAPADKDPVKERMIVVAKHGDETEFPRQGMDLLKGFLGTVPPVEEIPEIDQYVNRPEILPEGG